jgi:microsomal epoxide hydrolase
VSPKEIQYTPRKWLEARYNLKHFTLSPRGGHFAAMEEPGLFVDDLRAFSRTIRPQSPPQGR